MSAGPAPEAYTVKLTEAEADELRALLPAGRVRRRRRGPRVENHDFGAFAARAVRALAKRAGGDVDLLPELLAVYELAGDQLREAAVACNEDGYSWAEIATRLNMSKQGAQQRFAGRRKANGSGPKQRQQHVDGQTTIEDHT